MWIGFVISVAVGLLLLILLTVFAGAALFWRRIYLSGESEDLDDSRSDTDSPAREPALPPQANASSPATASAQ